MSEAASRSGVGSAVRARPATEVLRSYDVLDRPLEDAFEGFTRLAARLCGVPTALLTFVDEERQHFAASTGFSGGPTSPLDVGFCPEVVLHGRSLVIPNAADDDAHRANAAVVEGGVRFYAGVPLLAGDGHALGTLCVLDTVPRPEGLTETQADMLSTLAREVMKSLELRAEAHERRRSERLLEALVASDSEFRFTANADWGEIRRLPEAPGQGPVPSRLVDHVPEGDQASVFAEIARATAARTACRIDHRMRRADGSVGWASSRAVPMLDRTGAVVGWLGATSDIDDRKKAESALRDSEERLQRSEAFWRGVFERLNEGFMIVQVLRDADGTASTWLFEEMNPAWERISGLSRDAVRGRRVEEVIPGVEREWVDAYVGVAETGEPAAFTLPLRSLGQVYDVRAFPVGPDRVAVLFHEVSAERREEARRTALLDLNERFRTLEDPGEIALSGAAAVGRALSADRAAYAVVSDDGALAFGRYWNVVDGPVREVDDVEDLDASASGLRRGEATVVGDFASDARRSAVGHDAFGVPAMAAVDVPVIEEGRLVAILVVHSRTVRRWHADEVAFVRDVADQTWTTIERRRAERALRENEALMSAILRAAPVGIVHASASGLVTGGNAQAERIFGHPIIRSRNVDAYREWVGFHPDGRRVEGEEYPLGRALGGEERPELEVLYRRSDGTDAWVRIIGAPVVGFDGTKLGAVIVSMDIDRERRAEAALRDLNADLGRQVSERAEALKLFGDIVQSNPLPICAFDRDLRLIAFNRAHDDEFFRISGIRVRIGDVFPDLFPPGQRERMRRLMTRAVDGETYTVDEAFGDPDFAKPHWEISYSPLRNAEGDLIGAFHTAKDVTEVLRAQAELASIQDALRQSQKMEAVGQLTGGLAHDFNNLLAGISGSLELMQVRVRQGRHAEVERYVTAAQGASKRAAALTHRLLAFSRRQTLDPRPTDVNRLVDGMRELVQRTVGPGIAVEVLGAPGLWPTIVDPSQLENALLNLCINARDAMPDGGRISIETANRDFGQDGARRQDVPEGQYVSVCVTDTGTGMPPDVVARVFEPFFTTKPIGEGTGLGLSMIYGFAQQSGGQVRVYSDVGKGTTVRLYIPRYHGGVEEERRPDVPQAMPRSEQGETVLVVDDEPTVRMLVVDILEDMGYRAIEADDSASGLEALRSDARIDLLVTDVGLPGGMNGRQMADAARVDRPGLKVLFITGYAEGSIFGQGQLGPGMAVLTKPFAVDEMAARIRSMIE